MSKFKPRNISIWLRAELDTELQKRGDNRTQIITRDLDRLYTSYRRALKEVRLSLAEASLIVDALNGVMMDANSAVLLWAEIADAVQLDGLDKKWTVDGTALVDKLRGLSNIQALAIIDAAERFWARHEQWDLETGVRECFGLDERQ